MVGNADAGGQGDTGWERRERTTWGSVGAIGGRRVVVGIGITRLGRVVGALVIVIARAAVGVVAEVNAQLATHDVVVVEIANSGGGRVWEKEASQSCFGDGKFA